MGRGADPSNEGGAGPRGVEALRADLAQAAKMEDRTERLLEVAAIVQEALEEINVHPVVVGGLAVAYWTRSQYTTTEIDFVAPVTDEVKQLLADLGFERVPPRHWALPNTEIEFEIPGHFLEGGDESEEVESRSGRKLRMLSLEDIVLWRTREFLHWHDSRGFQHVLYMLESPRLDRERLDARAKESGLDHALNWIYTAADEVKQGRRFEDWEIEKEAIRLEKER